VISALRATGNFAVRNAADLVGFARDTIAGRTGSFPPPRRILFSLTPDRVAASDDESVVNVRGVGRAHSTPVLAAPSCRAFSATRYRP
jgi:hypothetical protein